MFEVQHNQERMGDTYSLIVFDFENSLTFDHGRMKRAVQWFTENVGQPIFHTSPMTFVSDRHKWFLYDFRTICVKDTRLLVRFKLEFVG